MALKNKSRKDVVRPVAKKDKIKSITIQLVVFSCVALYLYRFVYMVPLVDDEEIIEQFREHRLTIEELVRRYREYEPTEAGGHYRWKEQDDTLLLLRKAEILDIDHTMESPWLPNPYSRESGEIIEKSMKDGSFRRMQEKFPVLKISFDRKWHRGGTIIPPATIWKDIKYFPEAPKIENNFLLGNVGGGVYGHNSKGRVFDTLNYFPDNWRRSECVYRKIEPQWFIRMCNSN